MFKHDSSPFGSLPAITEYGTFLYLTQCAAVTAQVVLIKDAPQL